MKLLTYVLVFLYTVSVWSIGFDFETVRRYHNQEIDQLLKDYTLEDSLTIRIELKRKTEKLEEQKVVNLPGLYQKTGESPDANIENIMKLYDRKVVFIKKREISEEELDLVKTSLKERLFLPDDVQITMLDDTKKISEAVQNAKTDFVFGAYNTLIKNGQFLWILIFSIGFIIALWVLAKVWKSKSEGAGGEFSLAGGDKDLSNYPNKDQEKDTGGGRESISLSNSDFETFNFVSLCQNINEAYVRAPGSTAHILWRYLSDLQSQIQFYETLRIQNQVSKEVMEKTVEVVDKVFSFNNRATRNASTKAKGFDKTTLSLISVELAKLKFMKPHEYTENALSFIYPEKADDLNSIYAKGLENHYMVLYKLFKDHFMNYLSSIGDIKVLDKINNLLMFDPEKDQATDEQYKSFISFLSQEKFDTTKEVKKSVNLKIVHMIYGLSEEELVKVDAMKSNEDLKTEVPSFDWVKLNDINKLKGFLINLSGSELKYFIEYSSKHEEALKALDERTQFRIKEKMTQENGAINWRTFRNKIKQTYNYEGLNTHESTFSKAS